MVGWQREETRAPGTRDAEAEHQGTERPIESGEPADAASARDEGASAERLAAAEAEIARLKDEYLRALAETENVRRRAQRDRQEASQYAVSGFARALLSVADNLRRALASVDAEARAKDPALDALTSGVEMTEKELLTVFERNGVKPIPAVGQPFDPHVHEALFELPDATVPQGTVVQVLEAGYTLHDRTLRPARVGIARGGPRAAAQPIAPEPDAEAPAETDAAGHAGGAPLGATEAGATEAGATEARATEPAADRPRSPITEDDGVIEFPPRRPEAGYRSPEDARRAGPGTRIDETH